MQPLQFDPLCSAWRSRTGSCLPVLIRLRCSKVPDRPEQTHGRFPSIHRIVSSYCGLWVRSKGKGPYGMLATAGDSKSLGFLTGWHACVCFRDHLGRHCDDLTSAYVGTYDGAAALRVGGRGGSCRRKRHHHVFRTRGHRRCPHRVVHLNGDFELVEDGSRWLYVCGSPACAHRPAGSVNPSPV